MHVCASRQRPYKFVARPCTCSQSETLGPLQYTPVRTALLPRQVGLIWQLAAWRRRTASSTCQLLHQQVMPHTLALGSKRSNALT